MSALLEQAIIDATALKEAALKSAENSILEKYAPEVRNAVASLLEQDEALDDFDMEAGTEEGSEHDLSLGAEEGEKLCPCPDDDEVVNVDFEYLQTLMDEVPEGDPVDLGSEVAEEGGDEDELELTEALLEAIEEAARCDDRRRGTTINEYGYRKRPDYDEECVERAYNDAGMTWEQAEKFCQKRGRDGRRPSFDEIPSTFDEIDPTLDEEVLEEEGSDCVKEYRAGGLTEKEYLECLKRARRYNEQTEVELTEENIDAILEELVVDIRPEKSGWAGTPATVSNHYAELELARLASTEAQEEIKIMKQALGNIKKDYAQMNESLKKAHSKNKKLVKTLSSMKGKLEEVHLSNARLFYTNRVLSSSSLNERQKLKIAEAISDSRSVNEAKIVYETLQNAVGPSSTKKGPKSLSEAINRNSPLMARRESSSSADTSAVQRMQRLAGISKK
jgi:DNA-binding transcriptional regulator YhcF (GntR family)